MTDRTAGNPDARLAHALSDAPANDEPRRSLAYAAKVAAASDDPCEEGGFDDFCRDPGGALCRFHLTHCRAPDYPCIDLLRHHLAVVFLEQEVQGRRGRAD